MKQNVVLSFLLLMMVLPYDGSAQGIYGDVNGDYLVNISDVNAVIGIIMGSGTQTQSSQSLCVDTETFTVNGVSFKMIIVEGGAFMMGATNEQGIVGPIETPVHEVTLSSYGIGETEVTQALWLAVMGNNPSYFSSRSGYTENLQLPVESVSWDDCQAFVTKLSELTGRFFRMPTEAEWEFAARGGILSKGYKYAGSSIIDNVAWYYFNYNNPYGTKTVASKMPNELGLYDMSGNVYEWCQDWFGYYSSEPQTNPMGASTGDLRVSRGGSWKVDSMNCCVSIRRHNGSPSHLSNLIGMRLALHPVSVNKCLYGDVNGDGVVNISDVNAIVSVILGEYIPIVPDEPITETYIINGVSFKMVSVTGGRFTMGATLEQGSDAESDEKPAHEVTLYSYSIGETEVTQALWLAVMGNNPSYFSSRNNFTENLQRPVEDVSWNDCQEFINKLNQMTGKRFRLPTEAEWEFAARGGNNVQGFKYAGSNTDVDVAWNYENIPSHSRFTPGYGTQRVGTKKSNELGLYDMSGNVWEWCQDWYDYSYYRYSPIVNPQGPDSGSYRVLRGGGWCGFPRDCRVSYRHSYTPDERWYGYGLRLAL